MDDLRGPLKTPNLDQLASEGILFTNFFTNSAVCSPSRAIMMTGCYPTRNGVPENNMILNDIPTLADYLNQKGYATGYAGKWHLSGEARPGWAPSSYGWTDNRYMFNRGHYKKITEASDGSLVAHPYKEIGDEENYTTDWLTNKAIEFIELHANTKFAYMVSFPDPHQPWEVREPFNSQYKAEEMTVPDSYSQLFNPINEWHNDIVSGNQNLTLKRLKNIKAMYSGSVGLIDHSVGRLIQVLEDLDLTEKTIVVFTSDHGEYMGEHGLLYKNQYFETAYRLPLIIRNPNYPNSVIKTEVFSMVDFMPGILGMMGIEVDEEVEGKDFSVILEEQNEWSNEAFVHHSSETGVGVFTPEFYLIIQQSGENMLFNRKEDPQELYNLYYDPEFYEIRDSLTGMILVHNKAIQSKELVWLEK